MKKYLIGIGIILIIGIYFYGCPKGEVPETPNVHTVKVIQNGGGLRFEWDEVEDADGYRVYADNVKKYEGTNLYFELTDPAMVVEIVAYNDEGESDPYRVDCKPVESSGTVYERSDPDPNHPSGYGWDASTGNGTAYPIGDEANWPYLDFYIDDFTAGQITADKYFVSPDYGNFNNRKTWFAVGTGNIAPPIGEEQYATPRPENPIAQQTYFFWLDRNASETWDEGDYFVKVKVTYVGGAGDGKVEFKSYFQKIGGLRWLKE